MWLFTSFGFFSIVKKHGDSQLTVRARVAADLDNLRTRVPELSGTIPTFSLDYPYRATVDPVSLAIGLGEFITHEIDYDNFRAEVGTTSQRRAGLYSTLWVVMRSLNGES